MCIHNFSAKRIYFSKCMQKNLEKNNDQMNAAIAASSNCKTNVVAVSSIHTSRKHMCPKTTHTHILCGHNCVRERCVLSTVTSRNRGEDGVFKMRWSEVGIKSVTRSHQQVRSRRTRHTHTPCTIADSYCFFESFITNPRWLLWVSIS